MNTRDIVLLATFVNALILGLLLVLSKGEDDVVLAPVAAVERGVIPPVMAMQAEAIEAEAEPVLILPEMTALPQEEWYVMKSGDNPWKVAKTHKIKFDDLLKLNGLNEERARNLKPGDRIRTR